MDDRGLRIGHLRIPVSVEQSHDSAPFEPGDGACEVD